MTTPKGLVVEALEDAKRLGGLAAHGFISEYDEILEEIEKAIRVAEIEHAIVVLAKEVHHTGCNASQWNELTCLFAKHAEAIK